MQNFENDIEQKDSKSFYFLNSIKVSTSSWREHATSSFKGAK